MTENIIIFCTFYSQVLTSANHTIPYPPPHHAAQEEETMGKLKNKVVSTVIMCASFVGIETLKHFYLYWQYVEVIISAF